MNSSLYVLSDAHWKEIQSARYEVAILPWGATEAHNLHLPFSTDTLQCEAIAFESARYASEKGARIMVLPTIPFGVNTGQVDLPFHVNLNPTTQLMMLKDILEGLKRQHIPKLLILNGHGGNDFKWMIRELQPQFPDVFLMTLNWYQLGDPQSIFEDPGDHGGEMETSIMMAVAPDKVLPLSEAGEGKENARRLPSLRNKTAWTPRHWPQVSGDTGIGDPRAASEEKGRQYLQRLIREIGDIFLDLDRIDPQNLYEEK